MPYKLYVDSRFRVQAGGSNSDAEFSVELPHPIRVKGKAFVDCFVCSNSFFTIRTGENDRIHLGEGQTAASSLTYRICTIAHGQYDAVTLQNAVTVALNAGKTITAAYVVDYDKITGRMRIGLTGTGNEAFIIFPAKLLKGLPDTWNAFIDPVTQPQLVINANNLMDSGQVTGFDGPQIYVGDALQDTMAWESINVQPYGQLFLRSSLGSGYDAIGPDGSGDIIRRVLCTVPLNDTIVDMHALPHDAVTVHDMEIASLSFRLTDVYGWTVNTHGHAVSFSIIFLEE